MKSHNKNEMNKMNAWYKLRDFLAINKMPCLGFVWDNPAILLPFYLCNTVTCYGMTTSSLNLCGKTISRPRQEGQK
jgi:hypothetical protein